MTDPAVDATPDDRFLDGNAAAGPLSQIFAFDPTRARGQCVGCGTVAMLAQAHVFDRSPGLVVRCSSCENVLMRLVSGAGRTWLDFTGLAYLQISA